MFSTFAFSPRFLQLIRSYVLYDSQGHSRLTRDYDLFCGIEIQNYCTKILNDELKAINASLCGSDPQNIKGSQTS